MRGTSLWLVFVVILTLCLSTVVGKRQHKNKQLGPKARTALSAKHALLNRRKKSAMRTVAGETEVRRALKKRKAKRKVAKKKQLKPRKIKVWKEDSQHKTSNTSLPVGIGSDLQEESPLRSSISFPGWVPHLSKRKCKKCIWQECPSIDAMKKHCPSGLVRDQCNCCPQCANGVGMPCYRTKTFSQLWLPTCGDDLECIPVQVGEMIGHTQDSWGRERNAQGVCSCKDRTPICGSNNATYDNICEFREASARLLIHMNINVTIHHRGPCSTAPIIDSPPLDAISTPGNLVSFRCETSGFPLPRVQWFKRSENNKRLIEEELPGYLSHAVTQMRGGPGKYQLTTWLTLDKIRINDRGSYICRSSNDYGMVDRAAVLAVTES